MEIRGAASAIRHVVPAVVGWFTGGPAHSRSFRALWAGQAVSRFGSAVSFSVMPLVAVLVVRVDAAQMSALIVAQFLPSIVGPLPAGWLADRLDRRVLLIGTDLGRAVVTGGLVLAAVAGALSFAALLGATALLGLFSVMFDITYEPFMTDVVEPDDRIEGYSRLATTGAAAMVVGPSIGGILLGAVGAAIAIFVDTLSYVVSAVSLLFVRRRLVPAALATKPDAAAGRTGLLAGVRTLLADRVLRDVAVAAALMGWAYGISVTVMPLFATRILGLDAASYGLLTSISAVGLILGSSAVGRVNRRFGAGRVVAGSMGGWGTATAMIALAFPGGGLVLFVAGRFLTATATSISEITTSNLRQARVSDDVRARVTSAAFLMEEWAIPAGAVVGGVVGSAVSLSAALLVAAGGALAASALLRLGPAYRAVAAPPDEPGAQAPAAAQLLPLAAD